MENPNNLTQAIRNGMCVGPIREVDLAIRSEVRDYLSQHFTKALLQIKDDRELKLVMQLWTDITGEKL